jgi:TolB protein
LLIRPDGSARQQLTSNDVWDGQPHLSPDGRRIVFASVRDTPPAGHSQRSEIYVMDVDGSNTRQLTDGEGGAEQPRWSPDGTRVAFVRYDPATFRYRILVMNADGSNVHALITDSTASDVGPEWSPDGTKILFLSLRPPRAISTMYVMNAAGTNAQMLGGDGACTGPVYEARWSPDGERIAYSCGMPQDLAIYTIEANGTGVTRISRPDPQSGRNNDFFPVWSPDGRRIAFTSDGPDIETHATYDLYVMRLDGTRSRVTTDSSWDLVSDWGRLH